MIANALRPTAGSLTMKLHFREGVQGATMALMRVAGVKRGRAAAALGAAIASVQLLASSGGPAMAGEAAADWMPAGPRAAPPAGFLDWCRRSPGSCGINAADAAAARAEAGKLYWAAVFASRASAAAPSGSRPDAKADMVLPWTEENRRLLDRINRAVNSAILEQDDRITYGVEDYWAIPTLKGKDVYGDCEDYVLMKRRDLIAAGVPAGALFIAVVKLRDGKDHAVLLVAADRGEMVLDNRTPWIVSWREESYRWIARQAPGGPFAWIHPALESVSTAAR